MLLRISSKNWGTDLEGGFENRVPICTKDIEMESHGRITLYHRAKQNDPQNSTGGLYPPCRIGLKTPHH